MTKKEHTTITELFQVLDLLESLDMQFCYPTGILPGSAEFQQS